MHMHRCHYGGLSRGGDIEASQRGERASNNGSLSAFCSCREIHLSLPFKLGRRHKIS